MQKFIIKKQSPTSMIIELDCNKLSAAEQITLFGKEFSKKAPNEELVFIQKNDFVFSIDTILFYDFDYRYTTLKKGNYPLKIEGNIIQVAIELSLTRSLAPK
jgi:hypothetical protein